MRWAFSCCATVLFLLVAEARVAAQPLDRAAVQIAGGTLEIRWSDAEDDLRAWVTPASPRAGEPLTVSVRVGPFEGPAYQGPVTLRLREENALSGETVTVLRNKDGWQAQLTPHSEGPHTLDFTYRSTRMKSVHATFNVAGGFIPRLVAYLSLATAVGLALALGIRQTLRSRSATK